MSMSVATSSSTTGRGIHATSSAPDVMVVRGVPKLPLPCPVVEISSDTTQGNDFDSKKRLYELGIEEYFLYDPLAIRIPQFQGFRLAGDGLYQPVALEPDGSQASRTTGVTLLQEGDRIRAVETTTGRQFCGMRRRTPRCRRSKPKWTGCAVSWNGDRRRRRVAPPPLRVPYSEFMM